MKWEFIDTNSVDPGVFGMSRITAVKVSRYVGDGDIRCFKLKGWVTFADFVEYNPISGKRMNHSEWWVFAAKGVP
jgi:hypothetical protein